MINQGLLFGEEPLGRTLADARAEVLANREDGIECPCCNQFAKVYRRTVTSTMARWLIELVRRHRIDGEWQSSSSMWSLSISRGSGDVAKLMYWGLIERDAKDEEDTIRKTSGMWRPTHLGSDFVDGCHSVPRHALIYASALIGFDGDFIGVRDAIGNKFDYSKLMRGEL